MRKKRCASCATPTARKFSKHSSNRKSEQPPQSRRNGHGREASSKHRREEDTSRLSELNWSPLPVEPLSGKQRAYLKSLAHRSKPVVLIGQEGISSTIVGEIRKQLLHHELIKVKWASLSKEDGNKKDQARRLAQAIGAHFIQLIGQNLVLYRQRSPSGEDSTKRAPVIDLPRE